jgi:hypothetical protein
VTLPGVTVSSSDSTQFRGFDDQPISAGQYLDALVARLIVAQATWDRFSNVSAPVRERAGRPEFEPPGSHQRSQEVMVRHNAGIVLLFLLAGSPAVCAQEREYPTAGHAKQQSPLRFINADMSHSEYRQAYRRNQRRVVDFMEFHSKRALKSTGISERAIGVAGTAALLPVRDTRFHLNRSRTLAVEFQDAVHGDRTLLLEFKRKW